MHYCTKNILKHWVVWWSDVPQGQKHVRERQNEGGLLLTAQKNASKEVVYGNFIYPKKVYLYWQVNMKIAGTALSMQTMLELDS